MLAMALPKFSVDEAFVRAVTRAGGKLVSELLPSNTNLPKNADFVFQQYNVIAELKRLEKDQHEDREFRDKFNLLYRECALQGRVPPIFGTRLVNIRDLPYDCGLALTSILQKPIKRRLRQANEQIKSTKKLLNMDNAMGLVILAHDGDYSIGVEAVINLVSRCIKGGDHRSINGLVYITGNMLASRPGDPNNYAVFAHCYRNLEQPIPRDLISALSREWQVELDALAGAELSTIINPPNSRDVIDSFRMQRPKRGSRK
jgi:hypothetical protein